jgi:cellulose biosynthesis protein BcsQ
MSSIITFYSFKGGVGRSMALANIGYLLATKMGKRVLCVDWDLEAPGLQQYFAAVPDAEITYSDKGGLIDLLTFVGEGGRPDWREYLSAVGIGESKLSILTSGKRDSAYAAKVLRFEWQAFFEQANGGAFIESLRDAWHEEFDFVLVDSRTGFTDSGGVCTVQLPDILVPVFTTTRESAQGALEVIERAQKARQKLAYDRSPLLIFPLPSRYDGRTQYEEAKTWLHHFADWFGPCYQDWLPSGFTPLQAIERTKLPYIGYFSFGTRMPAATEGTSDPESLGYAYNVAATIVAGEFQQIERLMATVQDDIDQPSRTELALFRMRKALREGTREWRSIDALAKVSGLGVTEALDILRGEFDVDFSRGKSGRVIVRLRQELQRQTFHTQRDEARQFFDLLSTPLDIPCSGYFEFCFYPEWFNKARLTNVELLEAADRASRRPDTGLPFFVVTRGLVVPFDGGLQSFLHGPGGGPDVTPHFWRLHTSALFYQRRGIQQTAEDILKGICAVSALEAAVETANAIRCLVSFYAGLLESAESITFDLTLLGVRDWPLIAFDGLRSPGSTFTGASSEVTITRTHSIESWHDGLVDHALDIAREVYLAFNYTSPDMEAARAAIMQSSG